MAAATKVRTGREASELASVLRPSLLRLTRLIRNQRVDLSVSLTQISAMGTLHKRGPMSAGELAACEKVQPPSMTKVIPLRHRQLQSSSSMTASSLSSRQRTT